MAKVKINKDSKHINELCEKYGLEFRVYKKEKSGKHGYGFYYTFIIKNGLFYDENRECLKILVKQTPDFFMGIKDFRSDFENLMGYGCYKIEQSKDDADLFSAVLLEFKDEVPFFKRVMRIPTLVNSRIHIDKFMITNRLYKEYEEQGKEFVPKFEFKDTKEQEYIYLKKNISSWVTEKSKEFVKKVNEECKSFGEKPSGINDCDSELLILLK